MAVKESTNQNVIAQSTGFLRESWLELKKVQKPTRQETTQATIIVLMMVFFFSLFLGLIDFLLGWGMQSLLA